MNKRILALLLALIMVLGLAACGKEKKIENPNLIQIGDYQALYTGAWITTDYDGDDAIVIPFTYTNNSDETTSFMWSLFYTALQGGVEMDFSTIFVSADSYETLSEDMMTDVAAGGSLDLAMTYKLNNLTDPIVMEFSDLMDKDTAELTIDVTKLEVRPAPDAEEAEEEAPAAAAPAGGAANYKLVSFTAGGEEMGSDMVELMGGGYIVFNGDGTGMFSMFGDVFPITYTDTQIEADGMAMDYTLTDGGMEFTMGDGSVFVMEVSDEVPDLSAPEAEVGKGDKEPEKAGYAFDSDFAAGYTGDWHGMAEFYDCTGDYSDEDGMQCEIVARIVFDEDGYCEPYIRLCLSQDESENFVIDSMDYDAEYDCMLINGTLVQKPLDPIDSFVELEGDVLYIGASYDDDSGDVFNVLGCLRRLDAQWDYENDYPYLPQDGVDFYMGMSFEEIVELYGYDTSLIPSLTGGPAAEEAPEEEPEEEEAPAMDLPFETGITFGDGVVELQQLKDFKTWFKSVNSYENEYYKPTSEEMIAQMGVNPYPSTTYNWVEGEKAAYYWTTADNKEFVTITLQPSEDGSGWIYKAISWTGGVN